MLSCARGSPMTLARCIAPATARTLRFASLQVPHRDKLFIDNKWVDAADGRTFVVSNPATETELFHCAKASKPDVDKAVASSRAAFHGPNWGRQVSGKARGDILRKMGALLKEQKEEFAILETLDNGKPINEARADMDVCINCFEFYGNMADNFDARKTRSVKTEDTDFEVRLVDEPVGVCGLVTPWNFPLMQSVPKVAPCLATGCSMVLKPSSVCTATSLRLGDLALAAGLPPGALNIISGAGSEAGQLLLDHPHIDLLSFTGSSNIGKTVLHSAANRWLPTTVELGGKGGIVVFPDVDVDAVVDWIMIGIFVCAGQSCSATSRLIVHKDVEAKIIERLIAKTNAIKIGDPLAEDTMLGPLTSKEQFDVVSGFVDRAQKEGAKVLCGGAPVGGKGFWYKPTILHTPTDIEAWREEIFGPVLCMRSFETEEEAIRICNNTQYGLGNAVLTNDEERCERVAHQLHAGVVWKNCSQVIPTEAPFGGFKASGFGKEYGALGFEEYIQTKIITGCKPGFSWKYYG